MLKYLLVTEMVVLQALSHLYDVQAVYASDKGPVLYFFVSRQAILRNGLSALV